MLKAFIIFKASPIYGPSPDAVQQGGYAYRDLCETDNVTMKEEDMKDAQR